MTSILGDRIYAQFRGFNSSLQGVEARARPCPGRHPPDPITPRGRPTCHTTLRRSDTARRLLFAAVSVCQPLSPLPVVATFPFSIFHRGSGGGGSLGGVPATFLKAAGPLGRGGGSSLSALFFSMPVTPLFPITLRGLDRSAIPLSSSGGPASSHPGRRRLDVPPGVVHQGCGAGLENFLWVVCILPFFAARKKLQHNGAVMLMVGYYLFR